MATTGYGRFLRSGGNGEFVVPLRGGLWPVASGGYATKTDIPGMTETREAFRTRLKRAADENQRELRGTLLEQGWATPEVGLVPVGADMDEALRRWNERSLVIWEEWAARPDRIAAIRRMMEEDLLRAFASLVNERRQRALGIDQYVWESRDDARVRDLHAAHDGKTFDWDAPPEGGHPGQAHKCRCWARPVLIEEPDWVPDTGLAHLGRRAGAEAAGIAEAVAETGEDILDGILSLPEQAATAARFTYLTTREAVGTLTPEEARELAAMRAQIAASFDAIAEAFRDAPEIAAALWNYVLAVEQRVGMVDEAYRAGLATEAQLLEAVRDRARLATLILLNVAPGGLAVRLLRRRGRAGDLNDREGLLDDLLEETTAARRHPAAPGWDVADNPGIVWGGPIREQGNPWEDFLDITAGIGTRSPSTFPTYDFYSRNRRHAVSAKTLWTTGPSYIRRPSQIYGRLKAYVDQMERFEGSDRRGFPLRPSDIDSREMILGVPFETTPEQVVQITRAIEYAAERGITLTVRLIDG
jgi:SPP1 gp7 family putative phage head morphogenesis protein